MDLKTLEIIKLKKQLIKEKQEHVLALESNKKLKEERDQARREAFWRMCEAYNGFHKNTDLRDPQWIGEIKDAMEYHYDCCDADGSVEELHEGYIEWVGANETDPYGTNDDE